MVDQLLDRAPADKSRQHLTEPPTRSNGGRSQSASDGVGRAAAPVGSFFEKDLGNGAPAWVLHHSILHSPNLSQSFHWEPSSRPHADPTSEQSFGYGHSSCGRYWDRTSDLFRVREARYRCANRPSLMFSKSRFSGSRWIRDSNPCIRLCRPLPRLSANPPKPQHGRTVPYSRGPVSEETRPTRADDETRTRDPHLGKVMRYQLRYIRISRPGLPRHLNDFSRSPGR